MWCTDPDKAFDLRCPNLCSEEWCHDDSNCKLKRKDKSMFISVKEKFDLTNELEKSKIIIQISKDKKEFTVLKHAKFPIAEGETYHISDFMNILTAIKS